MNVAMKPENWQLYVITDEELAGRSHVDIARAAIEGGAEVIQLRDKTASSRRLFEIAKEIRSITIDARAAFIVNDRLDIALACEADGVHIGRNDLPAAVARRLIGPEKILGVSASSLQQAVQAERDGADYIGLGPIFEARGTKADAGEPAGIHLIQQVRQRCSIPIIAIGGINYSNCVEVIRAGAHGVAVISAVVAAKHIAEAARKLKQRITVARSQP